MLLMLLKINNAHDEFITTPKFNKLKVKNFLARLAQASLASKNNNATLVKKTDFGDKLNN